MESRGKKRKPGVDEWMEELQELKKRAVDMNNLGDDEIYQLIRKMQEHKEEKPVTLFTEFVGRALDANIKKVFNHLEDEQVFVIGIYGMGGVGKTFLVTHVETEVKRKGTFKNVFWVTVPHNFSISRLQHDIAKRMGIKLEEDDDERIRAANLSEVLETKEKSILILDDVWKYIDLQKVGIPLKENGIKVILTTRLKHVCQQMDCLSDNNLIQMLPLRSDESEELFKVKLGHNGTPATLPPEVQKIATCIVNRIDGLPLGISMMARTMKGLDDVHRWKHTWNKLEKLETGEEVQEEVFKVLKRSYDNLMEKDLHKCFLYCALLRGLDRDELIMELVENGLINGRRSLEDIFVEGKTILDKLEAHSLLRISDRKEGIMHVYRSVTDMACRILKESQRCVMVKFPKEEEELTKICHMQEWEDLELFHLMRGDNIVEIPEDASPCCPRLSTFISHNRISHIPDFFFRNMNVLTVLNLSYNERLESLPNSLSGLRSLVSLVLTRCQSLKNVPPLGELQALSRLDISCCSIEKVPQGLEKLINLKWLDLSYNENLTMVGFVDVLPHLTSMQYLNLHDSPRVKIKVEDVQGMNMLECFAGAFLDCKHYNDYVEKILDKGFGPKTYRLSLGISCSDLWNSESILSGDPKTKTIRFGDCGDFSHSHSHKLPEDHTDLWVYANDQHICFCDTLSCDSASALRRIEICGCKKLESLFRLTYTSSLCTTIQNLEVLDLRYMPSLTVICKGDVADERQSLLMGSIFRRLKYLHISHCDLIEKLLTHSLVLQLQNLERIIVEECLSVEEIFAVGNGDDDDGSIVITLPKLTTLELRCLPGLKTVFKRSVLQLPNLERIAVKDCKSMEEIFAVGNADDDNGSSIITLPKLTTLELVGLPQLKTVCKRSISFGPSRKFKINDCPNLNWKWNYPTMP